MDYTTALAVNETVDDDDSHFVFEDYSQRIIIAFLYCVVIVVGTVGNTLVILAVLLSRKLRSSTNWFLINLAVADLLTCLSLPFNVVAMLDRDGWPLPEWVCAITAAIGFSCIGVSITTLTLIAYNRWYLLSQPKINFNRLYTNRRILIMLVMAWLYPLVLVLAPHFAGLGRLGYSSMYKACWHDTSVPTSDYYSLLAGPALILPFSVVIVIVYIRIFVFVSRHNRKRAKLMSSRSNMTSSRVDRISNAAAKSSVKFDTTLSTTRNAIIQERSDDLNLTTNSDSIISGEVTDTNLSITEDKSSPLHGKGESSLTSRRAHDRYIKNRNRTSAKRTKSRVQRHHIAVTKRLSVVVVVFFACLLPFGVSSIAPGSEPGIPWTGVLVTFNSCINPIIYAGTMPVFRQVMGSIILCRYSKIPKPVSIIRRMTEL